jgi:hypothetical protein
MHGIFARPAGCTKVAVQMAVFSGWDKRENFVEFKSLVYVLDETMTLIIAERIKSCAEVLY